MRHVAPVLLGLLVGACANHGAPAQPPSFPTTSIVAELEAKTVALVAENPFTGETLAFCSGVWVDSDAILTANHCVADLEVGDHVSFAVRGEVSAADDDEVEATHAARLAARDDAHDLALLRVKLPPVHATAKLAATVTVGELVETEGHPLGFWWSFSAGNVAAMHRFDDGNASDMWWLQSTAPISGGNSGGGLFNASGELLGVCHATFPQGENLNIYVPVQYVRDFLK